MKNIFKRVLSMTLALLMVLSVLPAVGMPGAVAHAAGNLALDVTDLSASWTDASNSQGSASWSGSGNAITGIATGYTKVNKRAITTTLTLTSNKSEAAHLSFDYTLTGGGSVSDSAGKMTNGKFTYEEFPAGGSVTITLTSPKGANNSNTLKITNLALMVPGGSVDSTFLPADEGGSYTVALAGGAAQSVTAETVLSQENTADYTLVATAAKGYTFLGWYSVTKGTYLSYDANTTQKFDEDPQLKPVFVSTSVALFGVGSAKFTSLSEAGAYAAASGAAQINLLNSGTISGSHTIPAGVTLLVPFDDAYTCYTSEPETIGLTDTAPPVPNTWEAPRAYRTLTLAADAKITVNGAISVSAKHSPGNASGQKTVGSPSGDCGWISMAAGSEIVLNSGANLYAWGYIEGDGKITANAGATVYENIQFTDFRGGSATSQMATEFMVFPMSQYYVQNIEVPTTYMAGASEYVYCSLYMSKNTYSAAVKFMGEGGMFASTDGYVTKDYVEAADRLAITATGTSQLNGLTLEMGGVAVNSSMFVLPINSNIDITILSGTTTVNQSLAMLPGSSLTVNQGATLDLAHAEIIKDEGLGNAYVGAHNLIIYDADNWNWGLDLKDEDLQTTVEGRFVHAAEKLRPVEYSAANGTEVIRNADTLVDVVLDINGTVETDGFLYSTTGMDWQGNGGSIISSMGTGKVVMNNGAGQDILTAQANYTNGVPVYLGIPMQSAMLKNADGSFTMTNDAEAGAIYYYSNDAWLKAEDATITYNANGGSGTMEPTNVDKTVVMNGGSVNLSNNTFTRDAYEFMGWNTKADGSGASYADGASITVSEDIVLYAQWKSTKPMVDYIWMDGYSSEPIKTENVEEGSEPNHPVNPTKPADAQYTYTFKEWDSSVDALGNVTYTATYTRTENSYEITWDINGEKTGEDYVYGATPAYKGETPTKDGDGKHTSYEFTGWSPAIVAVTGNATYTAQFKANVSDCYDAPNDDDHNCDTCGKVGITSCVDNDKNHACEDCDAAVGVHKQAEGKHTCDYCKEVMSQCSDVANDGDHNCDVCGAPNITACAGGVATCVDLATCAECGEKHGTTDAENHASNEIAYADNEDGTHTVKHACCEAEIEKVDHTHVDGTCVCGNVKTYTVTWSINGVTTLETYKHGEQPTAPSNPSKANDMGPDTWNSYAFTGWDKPVTAVTADATYTAQFAATALSGILSDAAGDTYYVLNGQTVDFPGIVEDADGNFYYFGEDNKAVKNVPEGGQDIWIPAEKTNGLLPEWGYHFDANGVIIRDGDVQLNGIVEESGAQYYYINGIRAHMGMFQIGSDWYYARSNGQMIVDSGYYCSRMWNTGFADGTYYFDAEGKMVSDGVCIEDDATWYYHNGNRVYAGLIEIGGSYYYVKTSGEVICGRTYWITKTNGLMPQGAYTFAADGKMVNPPEVVEHDPNKNGIVAENGSLWYYVNGNLTYAGLIEIEGDYYYVRTSGEVVNNRAYWITTTNGLMDQGMYTFGADGKMI